MLWFPPAGQGSQPLFFFGLFLQKLARSVVGKHLGARGVGAAALAACVGAEEPTGHGLSVEFKAQGPQGWPLLRLPRSITRPGRVPELQQGCGSHVCVLGGLRGGWKRRWRELVPWEKTQSLQAGLPPSGLPVPAAPNLGTFLSGCLGMDVPKRPGDRTWAESPGELGFLFLQPFALIINRCQAVPRRWEQR